MRIVLLISTLVLAACSSPEPQQKNAPAAEAKSPSAPLPSRDQARQLIESSPEWSDHQFTYASWSVPLRANAMNEAHKKTVQELRTAGWLGLDGEGNAILTEKAKADRRFLVRPNETLDVVPLAKKEITDVSEPQPLPDGNARVVVDWRWVPNEVGDALKSGLVRQVFDAPQRSNVTLMPSGDGWAVLIIEATPATAP